MIEMRVMLVASRVGDWRELDRSFQTLSASASLLVARGLFSDAYRILVMLGLAFDMVIFLKGALAC